MSKTSGMRRSNKYGDIYNGSFFALGKRKYGQVVSEKEKKMIKDFEIDVKGELADNITESNFYESSDDEFALGKKDFLDSDESMDDKTPLIEYDSDSDKIMGHDNQILLDGRFLFPIDQPPNCCINVQLCAAQPLEQPNYMEVLGEHD